MRLRWFGPITVALLLLLSAGCTTGTERADGGGTEVDDGPTSWGGRVPPAVLDCGTPDPGEVQLSLPQVDVGAARWQVPSGWDHTTGYYEDWSVESVVGSDFLAPVSPRLPRLNIAGISTYKDLNWSDEYTGCQNVPLEAMLRRLDKYGEKMGAVPLNEGQLTKLGGYDAVTRGFHVTRAGYFMQGWWLFTPTDLIFICCQWSEPKYEAPILSGCEQLTSSVSFG